jgi:hypothetical protein
VGTIEEIDLMVFAVAEEGGDDVEDKLCLVYGEQHCGNFMQRAVFYQLDPGFHGLTL